LINDQFNLQLPASSTQNEISYCPRNDHVRSDLSEEDCNNGYPTSAVADYVLGCMSANGNKFESLHQCSCSIDFIKKKISYEVYERAQTVLRAQLDQGQRGLFYREASWAKKSVEKLEKAQAESTLRCF